MSYHALARKYRPATFAEMVGQSHVTGTLRAALRKDKLSHAYLFTGPRGCGKTTVARLLAKALNCPDRKDGDACGVCEVCRGIAAGSYLDVLEIDAASHTGVDNIRDLRDMAQYTPTKGGSRVFIIDEVHMLSKGAFNALLKILEEPPPRVYFFFATTEPTKVPRTILSRCQRFDFRLFTRGELGDRIGMIAREEGVDLDPSGLRLVVSMAEGSMRDALSILDQLIAGCEGTIDEARIVELFGLVRSEVYRELNEAIIARDPRRGLALVEELQATGQSLDAFAQGVLANFRNLLVLKIAPDLKDGLDLAPEQLEEFRRQAESFSREDLLALIDRAAVHFERIHRSSQPRILLEAAVAEYALFESRVQLADLLARLDLLDAGGGAAGGTGGGDAPRPDRRGGGDPDDRPARTPRAGAARRGGAAAAETVPGWTAFIQMLLKSDPGLGACLMEGLPSLDEARGELTLALDRDKSFQMQRLEAQRAAIEARLAGHWKRPLKLRLVAAGGAAGGADADRYRETLRKQVAPTREEAFVAACRRDSRLKDLTEMLDGELVPEPERKDWCGASDERDPGTPPDAAPAGPSDG